MHINGLAEMLPIPLLFTSVAEFGGKFLFWDTVRNEQLTQAHEYALRLSKYFLPTGEQQAEKEKITLSPLERVNVKEFGHPLVRELWRPHITLGYYPNGLQQNTRTEKFEGSAVGVAFVQVGEAGTIAEILAERRT